MKKWAVVRDNIGGHSVFAYLETPQEVKKYPYIAEAVRKYGAEKVLPVRVNCRGGYCTCKRDDPELVRVIESEEEPELPLEERWPVNSPTFDCGWVSPDCITYRCETYDHINLERALGERFLRDVHLAGGIYDADDRLYQAGWAKVFADQTFFGRLDKMTDQQVTFLLKKFKPCFAIQRDIDHFIQRE